MAHVRAKKYHPVFYPGDQIKPGEIFYISKSWWLSCQTVRSLESYQCPKPRPCWSESSHSTFKLFEARGELNQTEATIKLNSRSNVQQINWANTQDAETKMGISILKVNAIYFSLFDIQNIHYTIKCSHVLPNRICSEKCIVRSFHYYANIFVCRVYLHKPGCSLLHT
jgi:hypothetical protein